MGDNSVFKRLITTLKKANKDLDLLESKQTNKTNKIKLFSLPAVFYLLMYLLSTKITESDDWTYKDMYCGLSWGKNAKFRCMPWHLSELWKTSFSSATGLGQLFDIIFNTAIFGWARPVFLGYQTMRK